MIVIKNNLWNSGLDSFTLSQGHISTVNLDKDQGDLIMLLFKANLRSKTLPIFFQILLMGSNLWKLYPN